MEQKCWSHVELYQMGLMSRVPLCSPNSEGKYHTVKVETPVFIGKELLWNVPSRLPKWHSWSHFQCWDSRPHFQIEVFYVVSRIQLQHICHAMTQPLLPTILGLCNMPHLSNDHVTAGYQHQKCSTAWYFGGQWPHPEMTREKLRKAIQNKD